ncbi:MAG: acyl-CoA dehydrogenase family protein, partial [Legionella sp.]
MDDLLFLDEQLHDDERMIRDSVARFVSNDVVPLMAESFEHAQFPRKLIKQSAELG